MSIVKALPTFTRLHGLDRHYPNPQESNTDTHLRPRNHSVDSGLFRLSLRESKAELASAQPENNVVLDVYNTKNLESFNGVNVDAQTLDWQNALVATGCLQIFLSILYSVALFQILFGKVTSYAIVQPDYTTSQKLMFGFFISLSGMAMYMQSLSIRSNWQQRRALVLYITTPIVELIILVLSSRSITPMSFKGNRELAFVLIVVISVINILIALMLLVVGGPLHRESTVATALNCTNKETNGAITDVTLVSHLRRATI